MNLIRKLRFEIAKHKGLIFNLFIVAFIFYIMVEIGNFITQKLAAEIEKCGLECTTIEPILFSQSIVPIIVIGTIAAFIVIIMQRIYYGGCDQ